MSEENYNEQVVSLQALLNFGSLPQDSVNGDEKSTRGKVAAFNTLYGMCFELVNHKPTCCTEKQWQKMLRKIFFGYVKETKRSGTTSVSQGLVNAIVKTSINNHKQVEKFIVCCNGGTGGCKFQVATTRVNECDDNLANDPIVYMEFELKGSDADPNLNSLKLGHYKPKNMQNEVLAWDEEQNKMIQSTEKCWDELLAHGHDGSEILVRVFMTGPGRECWEKSSCLEKIAMETDLNQFFTQVKQRMNPQIKMDFLFPGFMPQQKEADYEKMACMQMYENLKAEDFFDQDLFILGPVGVGRGSLQWTIGHDYTFAIGTGMDSWDTMKQTICEEFKKQLPLFENHLFTIISQQPGKCLIPLKSGFALLLNDDKNTWIVDILRNITLDFCSVEDLSSVEELDIEEQNSAISMQINDQANNMGLSKLDQVQLLIKQLTEEEKVELFKPMLAQIVHSMMPDIMSNMFGTQTEKVEGDEGDYYGEGDEGDSGEGDEGELEEGEQDEGDDVAKRYKGEVKGENGN